MLDADSSEREKLSGELDELEIAERVLAQFGGKAATTEKRRRVRPAKTTPSAAAEGRGRSERKAPGISISDASLKAVRAGQNPAVTGYDSALGVNQHGVREAKFPDTAGDLGHLGLRMRPRVARVGDQSADFPPFDGKLARAHAQALSEGKFDAGGGQGRVQRRHRLSH